MSVTLDLMEYANDAAAQAAYPSSQVYTVDICTGGSASASSENLPNFPAWKGFDDDTGTAWQNFNDPVPGWLKYDLGVGVTKIARKLRLMPIFYLGHAFVKDFKLQGSNNDSDWDNIYTGQHGDNGGWEDFTFSNSTAYRYYRIYITSSWYSVNAMGIKEVEIMEFSLQCYSENSIVQEGSYSLKGIAKQTNSLNQTLTRAVSPTIDLSGQPRIFLYIRASRTGSNIKIGIHDSGGTTTEITPNITDIDTWQLVEWDISGVADAEKDTIDGIIITIVNADADNILYLDDMYGGLIIVSKERNILYDSVLYLSKTRDVLYDSVLELSQGRNVVYDLVLELSKTRDILYDLVLVVSKTRDISYDSVLELSKTRDIVYDLLLELSKERNIQYDSVLELSQVRSILYDIFELIQQLEAPITGVPTKESAPTGVVTRENAPNGAPERMEKP